MNLIRVILILIQVVAIITPLRRVKSHVDFVRRNPVSGKAQMMYKFLCLPLDITVNQGTDNSFNVLTPSIEFLSDPGIILVS
ncbi:hypothetical protein F5051DRAFT_419377 [Lentinula edodes]|nr:hypothetical protein F5051DRAFT_419377 [Lentinula edodes]